MAADLQGFAELDRALRRLGPVIAVKEMRAAVRIGANMIRKRARENLEADDAVLTRRLVDGLVVRTRVLRRELAIQATVGSSKQAFYGMFLEFGTAKLRPRPWLQPAVDAMADRIPERMALHLRRRLARIARAARA